MKALTYTRYGAPDVVEISDLPRPEAGPGEVLIRVHASAVNTADWRLRAAAFPGIMAIPGRLMFGLTRPRNTRLGSEFAGIVEAVGAQVTRFAPGDRVYGMQPNGGASAEVIAVAEDSALAPMPQALGFDEAAALPFGGLCALVFLQDCAQLSEGQHVLILGASGGVGSYAVQIAKALGAEVTGVSGPDSQNFVTGLGADRVVNYRDTGLADLPGSYDLVFDTVGAARPSEAFGLLKPGGLFLPLNFGMPEIGAALKNPLRDRKIRLEVNPDRAEDLVRLTALVEAGKLRPVIDTRFPLAEARAAHALVETRHRQGSVILTMPGV
ncbi:NAD(P)-dependent alcohol dehydrogenase [Dinoroseobacter sp. S124A]|uniref:NAD(P)-dependent alcohol dehydrogenase n=1 Tax=Dinoroseobacter sp. S124A TaxID=3415128 RepID=UPI003C79DBAD